MLEARNVTVTRGGRNIVEDVSLRLEAGRLIAVVGPNGAGKSTLLRVLSGEVKPTTGSACIDGADLRGIPPARLAERRAVVSQSTVLSFPFTVLGAVMLGATVPAFESDDRAAAAVARDALRAVDLSAFESRLFSGLSGGERQRVHIARALCQLATAPKIDKPLALLLDEPTASLDLRHQQSVLEVIKRQSLSGRAVLLVIHDLNLAAAFADEIVVMSAGRIAARGRPADVLDEKVLSDVFGCPIRVMRPGAGGAPLVLPAFVSTRITTGAAAE